MARLRFLACLGTATLFIVAGTYHLISPGPLLGIIPPYLPWPFAIVIISGVLEIAGGIGLLIPALRRWAGVGLIILLTSFLPANIHMAVNNVQIQGVFIPRWLLWARIPGLLVFAGWILWSTAPAVSKQSED